MDNEKYVVPIWLSVLLVCLVAISMVRAFLFVPVGIQKGFQYMYYIIKVLECITHVFALIYCLSGCKKKDASFFKIFSITYALFALITIYGKVIYTTIGNMSICPAVFSGIVSILLWIFAFVKNLGWKKSLLMALIIIVLEIANIFLASCVDLRYVFTLVGRGILSVIFGIMVLAKYRDKANRGTV